MFLLGGVGGFLVCKVKFLIFNSRIVGSMKLHWGVSTRVLVYEL